MKSLRERLAEETKLYEAASDPEAKQRIKARMVRIASMMAKETAERAEYAVPYECVCLK